MPASHIMLQIPRQASSSSEGLRVWLQSQALAKQMAFRMQSEPEHTGALRSQPASSRAQGDEGGMVHSNGGGMREPSVRSAAFKAELRLIGLGTLPPEKSSAKVCGHHKQNSIRTSHLMNRLDCTHDGGVVMLPSPMKAGSLPMRAELASRCGCGHAAIWGVGYELKLKMLSPSTLTQKARR